MVAWSRLPLEMMIRILRILVWNHLKRRFELTVKGRDLDARITCGEEEEAEGTDEEAVGSLQVAKNVD